MTRSNCVLCRAESMLGPDATSEDGLRLGYVIGIATRDVQVWCILHRDIVMTMQVALAEQLTTERNSTD